MKIKKFCEAIGFSKEERLAIEIHLNELLKSSKAREYALSLTCEFDYENAEKGLKALLSDDANGVKMLSIMLYSATLTLKNYKKKGISNKIFIDTMKCFTRFVSEYKKQYGRFGFDRSFWVGRQLSLQLFRIGELEYECSSNASNVAEISIHIPSGCDLSVNKVEKSIIKAKKFFSKYYPKYSNADYYVTSWMVSPCLKPLLSADSKILNFQNKFEVVREFVSDSYKRWVFGSDTIRLNEFEGGTALQRSIKRYVLNGGVMTDATARLKSDGYPIKR